MHFAIALRFTNLFISADDAQQQHSPTSFIKQMLSDLYRRHWEILKQALDSTFKVLRHSKTLSIVGARCIFWLAEEGPKVEVTSLD